MSFSFKPPHTPPRCPIALSDHSSTTPLPLVWPVQHKSCIERNASMFCQLHSSVYILCLRKMQQAGGSSVKNAGLEVYARNSPYFRSKRNLTISDKNSCILNMQRGITKWTQINSSWTDIITASLVPVLQSMKTRNDGTECVENQSHTARWFASTPPIRESNGSDVWRPTSSDFAC